LGERRNGIAEARGSTPLSSTKIASSTRPIDSIKIASGTGAWIETNDMKQPPMKPISVVAGDTVDRYLCGIPMRLMVTEVTEERISCGDWEFDPKNGCEIDDYISDIRQGVVISWIEKVQ